MSEHKQVSCSYATGTDVSTVKSNLVTKIKDKKIDYFGDPTTWIYGVGVEYYKDSKRNIAFGYGTGNISNGEYLVSELGLSSID